MTRSVFGIAAAAALLFVATDQRLLSQEASKAETKKSKQRAEPRGPLPDYYDQVIDGLQRDKIYAIQKQHEAEIKALEDQLAALKKKINAEIDSLLRPDQLKRLEELRKEGMDKRRQRAAKTEGAPAEAAAAASKP
jgi:hypothetical protein